MKRINLCMTTSLFGFLISVGGCLSSTDEPTTDVEKGSSVPEAQLSSGQQIISSKAADASNEVTIPSQAANMANSVKTQVAGVTTETFFVNNGRSNTIAIVNGTTLSGTIIVPLPSPIFPSQTPGAQVQVPATGGWSQLIEYTDNPAAPFAAGTNTCLWTVFVNFNGGCTASVNSTPFGSPGPVCGIFTDPSLTFIDPTTCLLQVVFGMR
jgi:hypothetical protein